MGLPISKWAFPFAGIWSDRLHGPLAGFAALNFKEKAGSDGCIPCAAMATAEAGGALEGWMVENLVETV